MFKRLIGSLLPISFIEFNGKQLIIGQRSLSVWNLEQIINDWLLVTDFFVAGICSTITGEKFIGSGLDTNVRVAPNQEELIISDGPGLCLIVFVGCFFLGLEHLFVPQCKHMSFLEFSVRSGDECGF